MAIQGQQVVDYLMQFRGTPYAWGGNSLSSGIDCSGLLQQGFAHFGINISRTTFTQIGEGKAVDMKNLQVGDAIYFETNASTNGPDHVGIYIGNGQFLHAPKTGDVVKVSSLSDGYYANRFVGGRRFDGVVGGGEANNDWASQSEVERRLSPEEMAASYGLSYAFMNSDPSIKKMFDSAVAENWTDKKFQAEFRNSDWWKGNSDTARKALQMKASDPATWSFTLDANKQKALMVAAEIGASIPGNAIDRLAENMAMTGMSDEALRSLLADYIDFTSNQNLNGQAGMYAASMRKYADDMGVDVSQQAVKNYATLMIKGMSTQDDYKNFVNEQATSAFPAFAQQIKGGQTMRNIANPYVQMMAQTLEVNPNQLSLRDPTIMSGLNGLDQDGKPVGRTLNDFQQMLRGDPRWRTTQQAQDKAMNIGHSVLKNMGLTS